MDPAAIVATGGRKPLTLMAGVLRVPLAIFLVLVTIGKAARYLVIAWLT